MSQSKVLSNLEFLDIDNSRGRFAVEDPLDLGQLGLRHILLQHRLQALALLSRHPAAAAAVVVAED